MQKKGISTLEYSLLIAVVVAAFLGMQIYFKRALSGSWKSSIDQFSFGRQYGPGNATTTPQPQTTQPPPVNKLEDWTTCLNNWFAVCKTNPKNPSALCIGLSTEGCCALLWSSAGGYSCSNELGYSCTWNAAGRYWTCPP